MIPKFYIPVYFDSHDSRVHKWVTKNITHHELMNSTIEWQPRKGNGNIRSALAMAAILITFGFLLVVIGG